jgi:hypothetical protein
LNGMVDTPGSELRAKRTGVVWMYRKVRPLDPTQVYQSDLTDAQWGRLAPLLPRHQGSGKAQQIPLRSLVNGCLYLLRTGCQWRMLPKEYPKWEIVY